jgi:uncharacterized protein YndB with AHSA1/START domain
MTDKSLRLVVRRYIRATPQEVFSAWTDPDSIAEWMCPNTVQRADAQLDVRVGGKFRITMKNPGSETEHTGEYRVVEPPSRLVFTWMSVHTDSRPTLVTVELLAVGRHTEMVLTHENFVKEEAVPKHEKGWTDIANKLARYFEKRTGGGDKSDLRMELRFAVPATTLAEQFSSAGGVKHWWTTFCDMDSKVGGTAHFRFPDAGFHATVRIERLDVDCIEWLVLDSRHPENSGFDDLHDWEGTRLRFEVQVSGPNESKLIFTHAGLAPLECFGVCSNTWSSYLNGSLRGYLERGQGAPYNNESAA